MMGDAQIYTGTVVHKRLRPKRHALAYRVFSLLADLDKLEDVAANSRVFSVNRFNLLSFYDADHGPGDGTRAADHARALFKQAGIDTVNARLLMLAYPRVLGYVFNPLSVYYAVAPTGDLSGLIYEVNNTWGERRSYVVAAGTGRDGIFAQSAAKELHVSPFAEATGRYGFRVNKPGDDILVGVQLSDSGGALLKTYFRGNAEPWSDARLLRLMLRFPMLTLKIISAIHFEALKLWLKGVPLAKGQSTPGYSVSFVNAAPEIRP